MADPLTHGPVLAHPESLDLPECREALRKANDQLLQQAEQLHALRTVVQGMGSDLAALVLAHLQRDAVHVHQLLAQIAEHNVHITTAGQAPAPAATPSTLH